MGGNISVSRAIYGTDDNLLAGAVGDLDLTNSRVPRINAHSGVDGYILDTGLVRQLEREKEMPVEVTPNDVARELVAAKRVCNVLPLLRRCSSIHPHREV